MKRIYYFIKKAVHFTIITTLGILMFLGEPLAFFIISILSALISYAIYINNIFLLRLLHADFSIEEHKQQRKLKKHLLGARIILIFAILMFVLGLLVYRFPKFFSE